MAKSINTNLVIDKKQNRGKITSDLKKQNTVEPDLKLNNYFNVRNESVPIESGEPLTSSIE